jgi:hypothetical protein
MTAFVPRRRSPVWSQDTAAFRTRVEARCPPVSDAHHSSDVPANTLRNRLIESRVGAWGCSRRAPRCRQVAPQPPLPPSGWLKNGYAVLPAPDREWLNKRLSLPQVGSPPGVLVSPREGCLASAAKEVVGNKADVKVEPTH